MIGIYFSGTGNTKYCVEKFLENYCGSSESFSIEEKNIVNKIKSSKDILFAYPIYCSNLPKIIRDFITSNKDIWKDKNIFIICTMGLFSGDGTGCSARLFKKYGANIVGGLHLKMPDCIGDVKLLKKSLSENKTIVKEADQKIIKAVKCFKSQQPPKEGLGLHYHLAGLFGQRLWFYNATRNYSNKLKIDSEKCVGCGKCEQLCPMGNIKIENLKAVSSDSCTMCYRCVSNCPQKAITLLGKKVFEQPKIENYI